jgi:hypothetical protein
MRSDLMLASREMIERRLDVLVVCDVMDCLAADGLEATYSSNTIAKAVSVSGGCFEMAAGPVRRNLRRCMV